MFLQLQTCMYAYKSYVGMYIHILYRSYWHVSILLKIIKGMFVLTPVKQHNSQVTNFYYKNCKTSFVLYERSEDKKRD